MRHLASPCCCVFVQSSFNGTLVAFWSGERRLRRCSGCCEISDVDTRTAPVDAQHTGSMEVKHSALRTTPSVRPDDVTDCLLRFSARAMSLQVQLRAPGVPVAAPRRGRAPAGRLAVVASGSREQAAHAVVVGSLSALLAGAPLLDASAAFAAVRATHTRTAGSTTRSAPRLAERSSGVRERCGC